MDSTHTKIKVDIFDLGEKIIKQFRQFNVIIDIKESKIFGNRIAFTLKTKGNTTEKKVRNIVSEVQRKLKLPLCQVVREDFELLLVVAKEAPVYPHLPTILGSQEYQDEQRQIQLPYIIGHDVLGNIVKGDLAKFPHLLLGGSTGFGKSVGLQSLVTCIAFSKSPSHVNLVLIDVGASDLLEFENLSHLSCPIIRKPTAAVHALEALTVEMERRIKLDRDFFRIFYIPHLVVVIDEFPALFKKANKNTAKVLVDSVSALLQRGRHAKIHLVLAAQNPTFQNMKVDLSNITTRIAFRCAKENFSKTILDEGGAENLLGSGDLLLRSAQNNALQRIQGVNITPEELRRVVHFVSEHYCGETDYKFVLELPNDDPTEELDCLGDTLNCSVVRKHPPQSDKQLSEAILWTLKHDSVSINSLKEEHRLGWNKASNLIKRLEELGIVDEPNAKLPREVIPKSLEDIPEELMSFLEKTGFNRDNVLEAFHCRKNVIPHPEKICCSSPIERKNKVQKLAKRPK